VFLLNSEVPMIFRIYGIIVLKKICRICPRHCGPGPPALDHRSTDFIKRQSLATISMAQIKPIESVSRLLISVVHHRSDDWDGWLRPGAAPPRASGGGSPEFEFSRSTMVGFRWGLLLRDHNDKGNVFMLALIGWERQWCLSTVRMASGEASAPRTCAKASLSSLLTSLSTNCSNRRWKIWIWWLPRVRQVLDMRSKICTICGAIYRGF
jgi:hypothetical protein